MAVTTRSKKQRRPRKKSASRTRAKRSSNKTTPKKEGGASVANKSKSVQKDAGDASGVKFGKLFMRKNGKTLGRRKGMIKRKGVIERKQFATKHSQYLYVENGYRVGYTYSESIWSVFEIHNETVNVWVHIFGAFIFLYFLLSIGSLAVPYTKTSSFGPASNSIFGSLTYTTANIEDRATQIFQTLEVAGEESYTAALEQFQAARDSMVEKRDAFFTVAKAQSDAMKQRLADLKESFDDSLSEMAQSGNRLLKLRSELGDPSERFFELSERFGQSIDDAKVAAHEYVLNTHEYVLDKNSVALWPMSIFIITAIYCMSCSSLYHLFSSMDEKTVDHYKKLDLAGISLLICGSPYPYIYYHICSSWWVAFYLIGFTIVSSITLSFAFVNYEKFFNIPHQTYRIFRTLGYITNGFIFLIPISHIVYGHYMYDEPLAVDVLKLMVYEGVIYVGGSVFYLKGWPEVLSQSGRFDIFFSSHQIWHLTVLIACWVHYIAMVRLYRWRHEHPCPC